MDSQRFDQLVRAFTTATSRRQLVAAALLVPVSRLSEVSASGRHKKKPKPKTCEPVIESFCASPPPVGDCCDVLGETCTACGCCPNATPKCCVTKSKGKKHRVHRTCVASDQCCPDDVPCLAAPNGCCNPLTEQCAEIDGCCDVGGENKHVCDGNWCCTEQQQCCPGQGCIAKDACCPSSSRIGAAGACCPQGTQACVSATQADCCDPATETCCDGGCCNAPNAQCCHTPEGTAYCCPSNRRCCSTGGIQCCV